MFSWSLVNTFDLEKLTSSPAAHPNLPRQRRRASCRLVDAIVM